MTDHHRDALFADYRAPARFHEHDECVDVDSLKLSTNFFIDVTRDMLG